MKTIKIGDRGSDVAILQQRVGVVADGVFGAKTDAAVRAFQKTNGLTVDGIVGRKTWAVLQRSDVSGLKRSGRNIYEIIVHCADTPDGKDFTVDDIRKWHLARGFNDIGYHYVIYRDGSVHLGRDVNVMGAHCTGHNSNSIGVCYIGGRAAVGTAPKDTRTPEQKEALISLLKDLRMLYPSASIHGHRDFANKACPSFDATAEYSKL